MRVQTLSAAFGLLLLAAAPASAQTLDQELTAEPVATGLFFPLDVDYGPGDPSRLFISQQDGRIRVIRDGALLPTPYLDIRARVLAMGSQGLLGAAFHPDFGNNGYFFLCYTDLAGDTVIARYQRSASNPDQADPNSELVLLHIAQPAAIHNGGGVDFGPDGYLYVAQGDGGVQGDPLGNAQNLGVVLGKILRLDVDNPGGGKNYGIPPTNPFLGVPGALEEVWAYGLRNPYRIAFDPVTGDLYNTDVGERTREEVNFQLGTSPGGENYGWNVLEGQVCYNPPAGCNSAGMTPSLFEYDHVYTGPTVRCAVIGGAVYRGREMATLQGRFFFGDQCSNWTTSLLQQGGVLVNKKEHFKLPADAGQPCSNVSWGDDHEGEIYACCHQTGIVYKIVPAGLRLFLPDLVAGVPANAGVTGGAPNSTVYVAYSPAGLGTTAVPSLGVVLDLGGPKLATTGVTNAAGTWQFSAAAPVSFSGRRVFVQAAQTGLKSNVVDVHIQ